MDEKRFVTVYSQPEGGYGFLKTSILKDTKTGVLYLCRENQTGNYCGIGLTVMVDRDGKPLTDTYRVKI